MVIYSMLIIMNNTINNTMVYGTYNIITSITIIVIISMAISES